MEPTSGALPAVVLAHGFLGSRFDMLHLAERLAAQGMVVMSPEFPDARSGEVTADPSSMGQPATRQDILLATMADLQTQFSVTRVGLLGHSAGSGTISRLPGVYARVSVAGLVPQPESQPEGPFLVVHSSGDSTIAFQGGMEAVRARLASGAYTFLSAESEQVSCRGPSVIDRASQNLSKSHETMSPYDQPHSPFVSQMHPQSHQHIRAINTYCTC